MNTTVTTLAFVIVVGLVLFLKRKLDENARRLSDATRLLGLFTTLFGGRVAVDFTLFERVHQLQVARHKKDGQFVLNAMGGDMDGTYMYLRGTDLQGMAEAVSEALELVSAMRSGLPASKGAVRE